MGDIIVIAILGMIVGGIIYTMVRNHKKGKNCGCSGGCSGCAMSEHCQGKKE